MDALSLMVEEKIEKEVLSIEKFLRLTHKIKNKMGLIYHGEDLEFQRTGGFTEIKVLFPLKHFSDDTVKMLNEIPEIDRWHIIDGRVGVFFKAV
jgi:hypothetical protein